MGERRFERLSFEGGIDSSQDLRKVPNGMGSVIRNWQPHADGALHARNRWRAMGVTGTPPTTVLDGGLSNPNEPTGTYVWERDTSRLYHNSSIETPTGPWTIVDDLASGGGGSRVVPIIAGAGYVLYGNQTFPSSRLRKWDGATASDAGTAAVAGDCLAYHKQRFWSANVQANPNRLYFSEVDNPDSFDLSRYIVVGASKWINAIEPFGNGMLVGKRDGVWFLTGDGPATFSLDKLDGGAVTEGKAIIATSYGALMAGDHRLWIWTGSGPITPFEQVVSNAETGTGYFDSVYTTMAVFDGRVFVCSKDNAVDDNVWVWEPRRNVWSTEDYVPGGGDELRQIVTAGKNMWGLTEDSAGSGSGIAAPLVYRDPFDLSYGDRDTSVAETFTAHSGALPLGEVAAPATLMHLHLLLKQRNGLEDDAAMTITPVIDGVSKASKPISPRTPPATFRERVDFDDVDVGFSVRFDFSHALTTGDEATFDILDAVLEYEVSAPR